MSLQFNVAQFLKSDTGDRRSYDFESDEPIDLSEEAIAHGVSGQAKLTLTNFGILTGVKADAILHLMCARCVEPFQSGVHVEFDEEYLPTVDVDSGQPLSHPSEGLISIISANHTIDLTEAIRENLLLGIEMIPLCSSECRGLCPTCGANLNVHQCACELPAISGPFAVLQGLLETSAQH